MGIFQPALLWSPLGLAFDDQGNLYVTEVSPGVHRVMIFDEHGALVREFGVEGEKPGEFAFPNGILVTDEAIYVSDSNNHRLQVFDKEGKFQTIVGAGVGEGSLGLPRGLTIDREGHILVVDTIDHDVHVYSTGSRMAYLFSFGVPGVEDGELNYPNDIVSDGMRRFYIADTRNNRVQVWGY